MDQSVEKELRKDALDKIELRIKGGFESVEEIVAAVSSELVGDHETISEVEVQRLVRTVTEDAFRRQQQIEESWSQPTDCDRLDWVFDYLDATGVAARQNYLCCQTCALSAISIELEESSRTYGGFVYYHAQDTEGAVETGFLRIGYGAADDSDKNALRTAVRFMKAALKAGLTPHWSGDKDERIRIKLDWRRRRTSGKRFVPVGVPDPRVSPDKLFEPLGVLDDDDTGIEYQAMPAKQKESFEASKRRHLEREKAARERAMAPPRPSDELCLACAANMVIRQGRYGDYLACTRCQEQRPFLKLIGVACPRQGCPGQIVEKQSSGGKKFYNCSNTQEKCDSAYWYPPLISGGPDGGNACPKCKKILLFQEKKAGPIIACSSRECDFSQYPTGQEVHI